MTVYPIEASKRPAYSLGHHVFPAYWYIEIPIKNGVTDSEYDYVTLTRASSIVEMLNRCEAAQQKLLAETNHIFPIIIRKDDDEYIYDPSDELQEIKLVLQLS
jgi:hypothetical protein